MSCYESVLLRIELSVFCRCWNFTSVVTMVVISRVCVESGIVMSNVTKGLVSVTLSLVNLCVVNIR